MNSPKLSALSDIADVRLPAADGYELGGTLFAAPTAREPRQVALVHCGAGIAQVRYRHFARYLADAGIPVLTYDYRGIGRSRPDSLRGFRATIEDWAEYDCAGAIGWLRERFPSSAIVGIAHSIGALLHGAAHNAGEQAQLVMIGAHTGYYGDYRAPYRLPMAVTWHGLMPALTWMLGYFPARRLGLGEDIPAGIALQWAGRWSANLRSRSMDPAQERTRRLLDRCAALERPALILSISDDAFATVASAKRVLSYYPRLVVRQHSVLTPADAGVKRLGHFGFFRRSAGATLWPRLIAQLEPQPA